ncbi:hypothetical protein F4780DRAFT_636693 [Xylariomycetidae sp. FL0641]|nr:hypothetical protein F4780DRAFT_636693 [Xylariomycetidae sp. FL0641]
MINISQPHRSRARLLSAAVCMAAAFALVPPSLIHVIFQVHSIRRVRETFEISHDDNGILNSIRGGGLFRSAPMGSPSGSPLVMLSVRQTTGVGTKQRADDPAYCGINRYLGSELISRSCLDHELQLF